MVHKQYVMKQTVWLHASYERVSTSFAPDGACTMPTAAHLENYSKISKV